MRSQRHFATAVAALFAGLALAGPADAASLPEIRTSAVNKVPSCVTPDRLMSFLVARNDQLPDKLKDIARLYKVHGDALGVRWDYAFFQMILETNYLKYKTGSGRMGDAKPRQNNFAGLGTTGGGVPGEAFTDVSTGVRAQIEHLVAYAGERVDKPVAKRTADNQDDIVKRSQRLGRPVRFSDLQMRWAMDRGYANKMGLIAERFHDEHCNGKANTIEASVGATKPPTPIAVHTGRLVTTSTD
jgi:hypothetical protein